MMDTIRVGIFGLGSIGRVVVSGWGSLPAHLALVAICVRPHQVAAARTIAGPDTAIVTSMDDLLSARPTIVVEAAGQDGARDHAAQILRSGCDLYLLSTGILADAAVQDDLVEAARSSGAAILIPAGAMAGFDGLQALREQGLRDVIYTSTKPPAAWQGTPAAEEHDLDGIVEATVVFDGSARDAARRFPKNANLAAAVALAGLGLDATRVVLIADPSITGNTGRLDARGDHGRLLVEVGGEAAAANPKSSAVVGKSVLASLANRAAAISYV